MTSPQVLASQFHIAKVPIKLAFIGECRLNIPVRIRPLFMPLAAMASPRIEVVAVTAAFPLLAAGILSES